MAAIMAIMVMEATLRLALDSIATCVASERSNQWPSSEQRLRAAGVCRIDDTHANPLAAYKRTGSTSIKARTAAQLKVFDTTSHTASVVVAEGLEAVAVDTGEEMVEVNVTMSPNAAVVVAFMKQNSI